MITEKWCAKIYVLEEEWEEKMQSMQMGRGDMAACMEWLYEMNGWEDWRPGERMDKGGGKT